MKKRDDLAVPHSSAPGLIILVVLLLIIFGAILYWMCSVRLLILPDFITEADFRWAVETASAKKKLDCSPAEFFAVDEGLCVQMMHLGPFDDEPASVARMDAYLAEQGYANDFSPARLHHEIYLSDARKVPPEKWKTVIRHPIRKLP